MKPLPPVRRFEMGASATGMDGFLEKSGWLVGKIGSVYTLKRKGERGRPKRVNIAKVMEVLDEERMKMGLEPIKLRKKKK